MDRAIGFPRAPHRARSHERWVVLNHAIDGVNTPAENDRKHCSFAARTTRFDGLPFRRSGRVKTGNRKITLKTRFCDLHGAGCTQPTACGSPTPCAAGVGDCRARRPLVRRAAYGHAVFASVSSFCTNSPMSLQSSLLLKSISAAAQYSGQATVAQLGSPQAQPKSMKQLTNS